MITNRTDNSKHHIEKVLPSISGRTLGVLLSPVGDGRDQLRLCLSHAKKFLGKFKNSSMPNKAKWIAITTVIEPAILYPLLNTTYSPKDICPIDSCLSQMKCSALGLNRNFPRVVLHGPTGLGGLGIPSICQKNIKDLITYFLYNLHRPSPIREKLEASIIYTQMEVGTFSHFFTIPYECYGHLATEVTCVQLWRETEPYGLQLRCAPTVSWVPDPITSFDKSLMNIAVSKYNKKGSYIINKCRIYLQVLSVMDLLIFGTVEVHPSYMKGTIPPSRVSLILWPQTPTPPKHYWSLWTHFLRFYIKPIIDKENLHWEDVSQYRFRPSFFKHRYTPHLPTP
jgi:hypothetical protein